MKRKPARPAAKSRSRKTTKRVKKTRLSRNTAKTLLFVLIVLVSFIFIAGTLVYRNLTKNFASADSPNSYSLRDQKIYSVLYVLVDDLSTKPVLVKELSMVFIDKNNKKAVRYSIPVNSVVDIPGTFGEEPLSKVFALGSLNSENEMDGGIALMDKSISNLFGYKVDRYIVLDSKLEGNFDALLETGNMSLSLGPAKTDFSFLEFYEMYKFLSTLPSDRLMHKDYSQDYLQNQFLVDDEIQDLTFDSDVAEEKKNIAVLNGADLPGLAGYASRYIENMGGRVVTVGNADKIYDESMLIVDDLESQTVKKIVHTFGFVQVVKKDQVELLENEVSRSDIVLIFGLDSGSLL